MAKADYVFTAELDDSQIETTLNNIDERVEGLVGKFEGLGAAIEGLGSGSLQRLSQLGSPDAALLGFEELEGLLNRIIDKAREVEATAATSTTRGGQAQPSLSASLQPEPTGRAAQEAAVQEDIARANAALRRQQEEMRKAKEAAAKKQATLVALAAAELKLTARADDVTSSFIDQAAAGSRTLDAFEEVVSQTSRLSTANIELAKDTAEAKQRIREIGAELSKDNLDPEAAEALRAEVADIIETFNRENEARERRASLAREAVAAEERLRQEADLLGQAERNTAAAQEEFNQALRAFPDVQARLDAIARE